MNKKPRRHFTPEQKAELLKKHLVGKMPISTLCDENQLQPSVFYEWQRRFFEKGHLAFVDNAGPSRKEQELEQRVAALEARLVKKDSVIAEVSQEYVQLKKLLGEP